MTSRWRSGTTSRSAGCLCSDLGPAFPRVGAGAGRPAAPMLPAVQFGLVPDHMHEKQSECGCLKCHQTQVLANQPAPSQAEGTCQERWGGTTPRNLALLWKTQRCSEMCWKEFEGRQTLFCVLTLPFGGWRAWDISEPQATGL